MPIVPPPWLRISARWPPLTPNMTWNEAMQQIASAAKALLVDMAGLMLADERGQLRWAAASDRRPRSSRRARSGWGRVPVSMPSPSTPRWPCGMRPRNRTGARSPTWSPVRRCGPASVFRCSWKAVQSAAWICTQLHPGTGIRREISAAQVYAALAATLLSQAAALGQGAAGRAVAGGVGAPQPDRAGQGDADGARGDRRRGRVRAAAGAARSSRRPLIDVVDEVLEASGSHSPR